MAEKEYIERNALIELLRGDLPNFANDVSYWGDEHIAALADHLIANGVVEVVRCRDCKYGETSTCPITGVELFICRHGHLNRAVEKDHFCSCGERREQG